MAAQQGCAAVGSSFSATACPGELGLATALGGPSGALGLGHGHSEAVVSSGHVHGGTVAHSARGGTSRSDETIVDDGSLSSGMVLGFTAMWQHALEGYDGV